VRMMRFRPHPQPLSHDVGEGCKGQWSKVYLLRLPANEQKQQAEHHLADAVPPAGWAKQSD